MTMDPDYLPFHPNPSKPTYVPPAGAVDAHCHVFGPGNVFPYAPERKYTPCDAPKEKLFELRDFLGFDKNVIVQASCHDPARRYRLSANYLLTNWQPRSNHVNPIYIKYLKQIHRVGGSPLAIPSDPDLL